MTIALFKHTVRYLDYWVITAVTSESRLAVFELTKEYIENVPLGFFEKL